MKKNKKQGFSLIELLVVVAIMGLLSAMAVISLNTARARARDARRLSDVKQIQTALEMYFADINNYPTTPAAFEGACLSNSGFAATCGADIYMAKIPQNPEPRGDGDCPDTNYTYQAVAQGTETLASYYIKYCIGDKSGDITVGTHYATPNGIAND